eukprot:CAMPEP_0116045342 /NCGR_PEP_ID=MMETSP0321-20121206/27561_1 /TAXON_ID=163516 /ORGANISM="Leptocylindrus danicus var. danicus, Strain B650" /LENGTH=225 /DNA_ID=CAMNT_0003526657 /DNA_START=69 /DNA_END=747 /DNA_ORIENTATION=+
MTCISQLNQSLVEEIPSYSFEDKLLVSQPPMTCASVHVRNSSSAKRQRVKSSPPQDFQDLLLRQLKFQLSDLKSAATEAINSVRELVNQLNEYSPKSYLDLTVSSEILVVDTERCVDDYYNKFCLNNDDGGNLSPEKETDLMTSYLGRLVELISKLSVASLQLEQKQKSSDLEQICIILDEMEQRELSRSKKRKASDDDGDDDNDSFSSLIADQMSLLRELRRCV